MMSVEPLEMLARSELFDGASPDDFEPLARSAVIRHYRRGSLIWGAGDRAETMHLVLSGEVLVSRVGPDGEEYVVEAFVAGDVMGIFHFAEHSPVRSLDARAASATSCWIVSREDFMRWLEGNPKLMMLMLRTYSRWIVQRDLQDVDGSFRSLASRVATKLLHLADKYGQHSEHGVEVSIRVTEETLANMIGASRENVSRAIAQLRRAGDVRRERGRLLLPKPDEMRIRYSWVTEEEARVITAKERAPARRSKST
jgi:CRP-like cAMP-binding protein